MKTGIAKLFLILSAATLLCMPAQIFASVSNDQVLSQHVKEADGTSGQNTNSGSGIKTGHIQDGAVTDAKITGPISASKISSTGLNADTVDGKHAADLALVGHNHDTVYQKKYGKMAVVAQSGGDYTNPVAAMNDLATWCGTPSGTNKCLLKIMSGVYDLGGSALETRSFVDVEGSGENVTLLKSTDYVIRCSDNVEVRWLTAESTSGSNSTAFYVAGSTRLTHVTAKASGALYHNIGIEIRFGSPLITDVTVELLLGNQIAKNWGIIADTQDKIVTLNTVRITAVNGEADYAIGAYSGELSMNNVTAKTYGGGTASYGIWASGSIVSMKNSYVYGESAGIIVQSPVTIQNSTIKGYSSLIIAGSTPKISLSQIDGPFNIESGGLTCFNVYDANFMPLTCP